MKTAAVLLFLFFSTACTASSQKISENPKSETPNSQSKQMVLVELFTSEG